MYAGTVGKGTCLVVRFAPDLRRDAGSHTWSRAQGFCALARCRGDGLPTCSLKISKGRGTGDEDGVQVATPSETSEVRRARAECELVQM